MVEVEPSQLAQILAARDSLTGAYDVERSLPVMQKGV
jgi:hypothetical protein